MTKRHRYIIIYITVQKYNARKAVYEIFKETFVIS